MFIYSFQHFVIYHHVISLAPCCHPSLLQLVLPVGGNGGFHLLKLRLAVAFLAVFLIPFHLTDGVGSCLLPHLAVAHLEEQQSVVVFLYQLFHCLVGLGERVGFLLHHLGYCESSVRRLHHFAHLALGNGVAQVAFLYKIYNVRAQGVVWFELLAVGHLYYVITHGREKRLARLSLIKGECHILKLLEGLPSAYPWQQSSSLCRAGVLRESRCKV